MSRPRLSVQTFRDGRVRIDLHYLKPVADEVTNELKLRLRKCGKPGHYVLADIEEEGAEGDDDDDDDDKTVVLSSCDSDTESSHSTATADEVVARFKRLRPKAHWLDVMDHMQELQNQRSSKKHKEMAVQTLAEDLPAPTLEFELPSSFDLSSLWPGPDPMTPLITSSPEDSDMGGLYVPHSVPHAMDGNVLLYVHRMF